MTSDPPTPADGQIGRDGPEGPIGSDGPDPSEVPGARGSRSETRRAIRERLARGLYALERSRDRTTVRDRQASWDQLNQGRRTTRLAHADELLSTLVDAFGFDWRMVTDIRAAVDAAGRPAGGTESPHVDALRAVALLEALLPRPVEGGGEPGEGVGDAPAS